MCLCGRLSHFYSNPKDLKIDFDSILKAQNEAVIFKVFKGFE